MNISSTLEILLYSSFIVWIFPAIRQYRGRFFFIFFVLAVGDPIAFISVVVFNFNLGPTVPLLVSYIVAIIVLYKLSEKKPSKLSFIFCTIVLISPLFSSNYKFYYIAIVILIIFVFYNVLIFFIKKNIDEKAVNLFYIAFLLYELLNIFKISNLLIGITNAWEYHILTSIFQVALGFYFSIFREDSPRNFIKL